MNIYIGRWIAMAKVTDLSLERLKRADRSLVMQLLELFNDYASFQLNIHAKMFHLFKKLNGFKPEEDDEIQN